MSYISNFIRLPDATDNHQQSVLSTYMKKHEYEIYFIESSLHQLQKPKRVLKFIDIYLHIHFPPFFQGHILNIKCLILSIRSQQHTKRYMVRARKLIWNEVISRQSFNYCMFVHGSNFLKKCLIENRFLNENSRRSWTFICLYLYKRNKSLTHNLSASIT